MYSFSVAVEHSTTDVVASTIEIGFLQVLEAISPRSRCQQGCSFRGLPPWLADGIFRRYVCLLSSLCRPSIPCWGGNLGKIMTAEPALGMVPAMFSAQSMVRKHRMGWLLSEHPGLTAPAVIPRTKQSSTNKLSQPCSPGPRPCRTPSPANPNVPEAKRERLTGGKEYWH